MSFRAKFKSLGLGFRGLGFKPIHQQAQFVFKGKGQDKDFSLNI